MEPHGTNHMSALRKEKNKCSSCGRLLTKRVPLIRGQISQPLNLVPIRSGSRQRRPAAHHDPNPTQKVLLWCKANAAQSKRPPQTARGEKAGDTEEFDPPARPGAHPKKCPEPLFQNACCHSLLSGNQGQQETESDDLEFPLAAPGSFGSTVSVHPRGHSSCVCTHVELFFPRVRTPCGHGAQVIVEGREEQSDGGEKNKDPKTNPKPNTPSPQAETPPSCSLSSTLGETCETETDGN